MLLNELCADVITRYRTGHEDDPAISGPADGFSTRSEAFDIEFDTFGHHSDGSAMAVRRCIAT